LAGKRDATENGKLSRSAGLRRPTRSDAALTHCPPPSSLRPAPRRSAPRPSS
jgi:hypothetical protein